MENKKIEYEGKLFKVFSWQQKINSTEYKTFESIYRKPTVQIIALVENKIIILNENQPYFGTFTSLPGGQVDEGEEIFEAASRELLEETGYKAKKMKLFNSFQVDERIDWKFHYIIAYDCKKVANQTLDVTEKINIKLVSFVEFFKEVENKSFRNHFFRQDLFRIKHTPEKLEKFKELLSNT